MLTNTLFIPCVCELQGIPTKRKRQLTNLQLLEMTTEHQCHGFLQTPSPASRKWGLHRWCHALRSADGLKNEKNKNQRVDIMTRSPTVSSDNDVKCLIHSPFVSYVGGVTSPIETVRNHNPATLSGSAIASCEWIKADGFCAAWYLFDASLNF